MSKSSPDERPSPAAVDFFVPEHAGKHVRPPRPDYPRYRVEPGHHADLASINPDESEHYERKKDATDDLEHDEQALAALDTGGKDGTIRGVFQGVNPQGCQVHSFKVPSTEEAEHDFLWRYHVKAPSRGMITLFNRSHYEDVLVARVKKLVPEEVWRRRYGMINDFERLLALDRTVVIKFFLHISKDEQKRRLESRLETPDKHWKFSSNDLKERALWDEYMTAFEEAIGQCSTAHAPWYVVPANKKWYRNLVVARAIADTLEAMDPRYPEAEERLEKIVVPD